MKYIIVQNEQQFSNLKICLAEQGYHFDAEQSTGTLDNKNDLIFQLNENEKETFYRPAKEVLMESDRIVIGAEKYMNTSMKDYMFTVDVEAIGFNDSEIHGITLPVSSKDLVKFKENELGVDGGNNDFMISSLQTKSLRLTGNEKLEDVNLMCQVINELPFIEQMKMTCYVKEHMNNPNAIEIMNVAMQLDQIENKEIDTNLYTLEEVQMLYPEYTMEQEIEPAL